MCALQMRASTGIRVTLPRARLPPLVGDRGRQLAAGASAAHQQHADVVGCAPPIWPPGPTPRRPPPRRRARRTARASSGSCCVEQSFAFGTHAKSNPRTLGLLDSRRRSPRAPAGNAPTSPCGRTRRAVRAPARTARPEPPPGSTARAAAAAGAARPRRRWAAPVGGVPQEAAAPAGSAQRPSYSARRSGSDSIRYASVSSAARSAAISWNSWPRCWTLSGW